MSPKSNDETIQDELHKIATHIPNVRWIRIVNLDGVTHPTCHFDAEEIRPQSTIPKAKNYAAMSVGCLEVSGRLSDGFVLGEMQFYIIQGQEGAHFILPLGEEWILSFAVKGHPSIDHILDYFESRNYLAAIAPLLSASR